VAAAGRGAVAVEGIRGDAGAGAAAVGAAGATGAAVAPVGPPGGNVGSLMVGAAEGLGGRLMRTVSFLGWTLPVSFFGGTAPLGMFGIFSGIKKFWIKGSFLPARVKLLLEKQSQKKPLEFLKGLWRHFVAGAGRFIVPQGCLYV